MNVFSYSDYKLFLKASVEQNKKTKSYKTSLAKAAGCQKAFLSQVLHSHVHMTLDHGAKLCSFWNFSDAETDYFCDLISLAKAGSPQLKSCVRRRLAQTKDAQSSLKNRFPKAKSLSNQVLATYYSSWHFSAVHVLCSIPTMRTPERISQRLGLPIDFTQRVLRQLQEVGLVTQQKNEEWSPTEHDLFVPNDSPLSIVSHFNWRQRAVSDLQLDNRNSVHYTGVHALCREDIEEIKELFRVAIERSRKIVEPSKEEEMICITCDVFVV